MIPDEAVEIVMNALADLPSGPPAREILEVIQATAWDEGFSAGEDVGNWYAAPVTKQPSHSNPYRSQS